MGKTILVVDDAAFMRMMIKDILTKNGYQVVGEADNGLNAIDKYEELKPDLVTMDITMPEMDGITAVKEIRKKNPNAINPRARSAMNKAATTGAASLSPITNI
jgi:two-component system chemotaxis response regulator CheY